MHALCEGRCNACAGWQPLERICAKVHMSTSDAGGCFKRHIKLSLKVKNIVYSCEVCSPRRRIPPAVLRSCPPGPAMKMQESEWQNDSTMLNRRESGCLVAEAGHRQALSSPIAHPVPRQYTIQLCAQAEV
jgi:hypothetical protein